ncbi:DNA ligase D [Enhygromyxa salina]|uniref:DNA ligase (ATP) n=1 Tax=Enhygromyxa salina TaxID=215803 RepID=A0A2S9YXS3_9BACT|nr:DNA ligase D [Enhygromyxa salina]PRQ09896.1 putative DNA ligase-like protein [Enhygromyxa salina]
MAKLDAYDRKRDFESTPEPRPTLPEQSPARGPLLFVIQRHDARRRHYDLRLEHGGVLWSWAVPKGPSLVPGKRRLAVQTEDHPLDYADFEGTIPAGEYGGGSVLVWDHGTWAPEGDPAEDFERGRLRFTLHGTKLGGGWRLVRTKDAKSWLLIKSRDEFGRPEASAEIVEEQPLSALSGRSIEQVTRDSRLGGVVEQISTIGEPASPPPTLSPALATATDQVPTGSEWLHELKLDGYRLLAHVRNDEVRLRTRGGEDWTARLPRLAQALRDPAFADSVVDGELCTLGPDGVTRFELLQDALANGRDQHLVYYLFDLPFAAGHDLRGAPLIERKRVLRGLLDGAAPDRSLRFCDHVQGHGPDVFARACALGAEGVVSKRASSPYESRRSHAWRKIKCGRRRTVIVGGFTPPQGLRRHFGALLVGSYDAAGRLLYRGKVGAGFSDSTLAQIHAQLERLRQDQPPFDDPPSPREVRGVTWVAPSLVIEVEYGELTAAGKLRHGRFIGIHGPEPKPDATQMSKSKSKPKPKSAEQLAVRLTHPEKLLYPDLGLRKRDVADYLMQIAEWMLPHVRDRPLTMVRCPDGVDGDCFYQKHAMAGLPDTVSRARVRDSDGAQISYPCVTDALGLVGLVQMSVLELHVWGARVDAIEHPDRLVFDLDPDLELGFDRVVDAAIEIRDRLAELGLVSFVKTTGGKGLHVVAPIEPRHDFEHAKAFCRAFAQRLAADAPQRYTAVAAKSARRGKIFVDYLRNGRGATSVAAYSMRAKPGALVSTPLAWDELSPELRPAAFSIMSVPDRLASLSADPWGALASTSQVIEASACEAVGLDTDCEPS